MGIKIFKTLHDLNLQFMKNVFQKTKWITHKPPNIKVYSHNTVRHSEKSLTTLGPRIWNSLPEEIKTGTD